VTEDQNRAEARRWFGQAENDLEFARLGLKEGSMLPATTR